MEFSILTTHPDADGVFPAIWNLPGDRNPDFVGRESTLKAIEQAFGAAPAVGRKLVITGMGGVGKTSLVQEYAWSRADRYDLVWWIRAGAPSTISADLSQLAVRMGKVAEGDTDVRAACRAARRALQKRPRWLLVFDGAMHPEEISPFFPWGASGHILITSRNTHWKPLAQAIPLQQWTRAQAVEFLQKRVPGFGDEALAGRLAAALGELPLALEQAAACIRETHSAPEEYLREYESHWAELLRQGKTAGEYPTSAAMAWELSFRQIESMNPLAAAVMNLCAFLAADVPYTLIFAAAASIPPSLTPAMADRTLFQQAVNLLQQFSLATVTERSISLHPVIALLTRDRLDEDDRTTWATTAVSAALEAFPFDSQDPSSWSACFSSLQHLLASATFGRSVNVRRGLLVDAHDRAGRFLLKQGQYAEARAALATAWELVQSMYGPGSAKAADIANNLGRVLHRLDDFAGARSLFEAALRIDVQIYGEDDPHVAAVANNYGLTLAGTCDYEPARIQFERAIRIYRSHFGDDHPKIASIQNNLGLSLIRLMEFDRARLQLEEALAATVLTHGPAHPNVACISSNLGELHLLRDENAKARECFLKSLRIDEKVFGTNHPAVARDLTFLGQLCHACRQWPEAVGHFERAFTIEEAVYGHDHLRLVPRLHDLGQSLKANGNKDRAMRCFERAAVIAAKSEPNSGVQFLGTEDTAYRADGFQQPSV